jgi:hypothetical protein
MPLVDEKMAMGVAATARIVRKPDVVLTWTGEEGVLVDSATGQVHVVNGTAARAWELCASGDTFEALRRTMASEYGMPESDLEGDLQSLLETFRELDLIELARPS